MNRKILSSYDCLMALSQGRMNDVMETIQNLHSELIEAKKNHAHMVLRNSLLRDRPDLPVERLESYKLLMVEFDTLKMERDEQGELKAKVNKDRESAWIMIDKLAIENKELLHKLNIATEYLERSHGIEDNLQHAIEESEKNHVRVVELEGELEELKRASHMTNIELKKIEDRWNINTQSGVPVDAWAAKRDIYALLREIYKNRKTEYNPC